MLFPKIYVTVRSRRNVLLQFHFPYLRKVNQHPCLPKRTLTTRLFLFVCCCGFLSAQAQPTNDSTFYKNALQTAVTNYREAAGSNLQIYKGAEYANYYANTVGNPFFLSDSLQRGTVSYDGIVYPDLPLKYDLVSDELLLQTPQQILIKLAPEKVDSFVIKDHVFVKLSSDNSRQGIPPTFYERLYKGNVSVWLKARKQPTRTFNPEDPDRFTQYDTYYIEKGGQYQEASDEKSLLSFFGEQRAAVKKYLHKESVRFKKQPGAALVTAAAYYDSLKK